MEGPKFILRNEMALEVQTERSLGIKWVVSRNGSGISYEGTKVGGLEHETKLYFEFENYSRGKMFYFRVHNKNY